ncbi:TPA: hypothetical protein ACPI87_001436 [Haemophilus influenzae]
MSQTQLEDLQQQLSALNGRLAVQQILIRSLIVQLAEQDQLALLQFQGDSHDQLRLLLQSTDVPDFVTTDMKAYLDSYLEPLIAMLNLGQRH